MRPEDIFILFVASLAMASLALLCVVGLLSIFGVS